MISPSNNGYYTTVLVIFVTVKSTATMWPGFGLLMIIAINGHTDYKDLSVTSLPHFCSKAFLCQAPV